MEHWLWRYSQNKIGICLVGWAEKEKMSKMYHGHEVSIVIHKDKDISHFPF